MVLNPDKCHFMLLGVKENEQFDLLCNGTLLKNSSQEKILGVTIDNKLSFDEHIRNICKTANLKLNALLRISRYLTQEQKKLISTSFIKSHFSYCPLIWMFCSKKSMKKINSIHERSLRLLLNDYESTFDLLLEKSHEISVHQNCINSLMIEVYKYLNGLSPDIMNEIFILRKNSYNLRHFHLFQTENPRSSKFGLDAIAYRASQLWQQLPTEIREVPSLSIFKDKIKTWKCSNCPCRSCKVFIQNVGYIQ